MKRNNYPKEYEDLWAVFKIAEERGLIGAGGKKKGYDAYKLKECTPEDSLYLIKCLFNQINAKVRQRKMGEFCPPLQSPERWIRNERFEDDITVTQQPVRARSRREEAREAVNALTGEGSIDSGGVAEINQLRLVK